MPGWISQKISQEPNRYQVLVKTWIPQRAFLTREECDEFYAKNFEGKLNDGDWRVENPPMSTRRLVCLINVWTVRAEFRTAEECERWAEGNLAEFSGEWHLAMRNSHEAAALLEYGHKKLGRLDAIRALKESRAETS